MMLMSSAIEVVLIFIALEISSIATYILAGFRRRAAESAESSIKYFLLGSFATAFFLYGVPSLPPLDPGRVRRRARAHRWIHVHRPESGGVRRPAPRAVRDGGSRMV